MLILNNTTDTKHNRIFNKLVVEFKGENLHVDYELDLSKNRENCISDNFTQHVEKLWTNSTNSRFLVTYPSDITSNLYFCLKYTDAVNFGGEVIKWHDTGLGLFIKDTRTDSSNLIPFAEYDPK